MEVEVKSKEDNKRIDKVVLKGEEYVNCLCCETSVSEFFKKIKRHGGLLRVEENNGSGEKIMTIDIPGYLSDGQYNELINILSIEIEVVKLISDEYRERYSDFLS